MVLAPRQRFSPRLQKGRQDTGFASSQEGLGKGPRSCHLYAGWVGPGLKAVDMPHYVAIVEDAGPEGLARIDLARIGIRRFAVAPCGLVRLRRSLPTATAVDPSRRRSLRRGRRRERRRDGRHPSRPRFAPRPGRGLEGVGGTLSDVWREDVRFSAGVDKFAWAGARVGRPATLRARTRAFARGGAG